MNKYILIVVFIFSLISFEKVKANEIIPIEAQIDYTVKFGDSYHNYAKGNRVRISVLFKNLTSKISDVAQELLVLNSNSEKVWKTRINLQLKPYQEFIVPIMVPVPELSGNYILTIPKTAAVSEEQLPLFKFIVIEPHKSTRLSKLQVVAPEWEEKLDSFLVTWAIRAPSISFGQVVLCGKKTWQLLANGDENTKQLIDRALKRDMSVIFLDFGPVEMKEGTEFKIKLPYDAKVNFVQASSPEVNFIPERSIKFLNYDFPSDHFYSLNGLNGVSIPAVDMRFEGKDILISNFATTGKKPYRFPVVELKPKIGKGKVILCQVITEGRLDEKAKTPRNRPELPAYDPLAVQFVLNLISASVGDELLK